jgi:hypothetical protein
MNRVLLAVVLALVLAVAIVYYKHVRVPVGRAELLKSHVAVEEPCHRSAGMWKAVDVCAKHVVVYPSYNGMHNIKSLHRRAAAAGCLDLLNPIVAMGDRFVVYPRCERVSAFTLPVDWERQINRLVELIPLGFIDFNRSNIMICDGTFKLIDQDDINHFKIGPRVDPQGIPRWHNWRMTIPVVTHDIRQAHIQYNRWRRNIRKIAARSV